MGNDLTIQDVEAALDESGTRFYAAFHMRDDTTYVKIRKKEARELLNVGGVEQIQWSRDGGRIFLDSRIR